MDRFYSPLPEGAHQAYQDLLGTLQGASVSPGDNVRELSALALASGCTPTDPMHFRAIRVFSEAGFFGFGGMLVGSHAFEAYSNALALSWRQLPTGQADEAFAFIRPTDSLSFALPPLHEEQLSCVVQSLEKVPADAVAGPQLDVLVPQCLGSGGEVAPVGMPMRKLPYLEFLLEDSMQAAILSDGEGAALVNIPDPVRFAVHKLLLASQRPRPERDKVIKDVHQASYLFDYLLDHQPRELVAAYGSALSNGHDWRCRLEDALDLMIAVRPELHSRLNDAVISQS